MTTMQRRHFEVIAEGIRTAPLSDAMRLKVAKHMADQFRTTNDHFDRDRFIVACYAG